MAANPRSEQSFTFQEAWNFEENMPSVNSGEKRSFNPSTVFLQQSVFSNHFDHLVASVELKNEPKNVATSQKNKPGFSLIECLLSLTLSLLIFIWALEIFSLSKKVFYRLKEEQETILAAVTALEKIREDLETAGAGLLPSGKNFGLAPLTADSGNLLMFSKEKKLTVAAGIEANQNFLIIVPDSDSSSSLRKGRALLIKDNQKGEVVYITGLSDNHLTVSPALVESYSASESEVLLLEKIEIYFNEKQKILRRRVNDTSGQPLVEGVNNFAAFYDPGKNLVQIILGLNQPEEESYELVFYPKNTTKS